MVINVHFHPLTKLWLKKQLLEFCEWLICASKHPALDLNLSSICHLWLFFSCLNERVICQWDLWNQFKVHNKDIRTMSVTSFWCLYCYLWTYFTPGLSTSLLLTFNKYMWAGSSLHSLEWVSLDSELSAFIIKKFSFNTLSCFIVIFLYDYAFPSIHFTLYSV